ncbi:MAG: hypothetical protein LBD35_00285 [Prevotellaceae bacterium]|jgi:hypothetical protein|nr:hypothetical protein [Prevotellaceae bacterium]
METKYTYNGEDITLDMMFKIEQIVYLLAKLEKKDFDATLAEFLDSATYKALQRTKNVLWAESSEYIADEYCREKQK